MCFQRRTRRFQIPILRALRVSLWSIKFYSTSGSTKMFPLSYTTVLSMVVLCLCIIFLVAQQIFPLFLHGLPQFRGYPYLLGKMLLPMIGPRRVDDRARGREVALFNFFGLQARIHPRAPDAPVDVERSPRIAAAAHGFEHFV